MTDQVSLRERLKSDELLIAPGVFEMISALVADRHGFEALYMTGYGVVASYLGLPDAGIASYTQMLDRVARIAGGTTTPLIADADTGYGALLNIRETVRGYEPAGAAAIQIEDQEFPKRCGHTKDRRVIPLADAVLKIRVAHDARSSADFLIVARTDARTAHGLDEALRRAEAFAEAGADVLFVESPENEAEMEQICRSFDTPLLANMVEGGRTPVLTAERLEELGYSIAIFPASGLAATIQALNGVYGHLDRHGSSVDMNQPICDFADMNELMGFGEVWEFDRKYGL